MKWYWKISIGFFSLMLFVIILNVGANIWIRSHLPKIINKAKDFQYHIAYQNLSISLMYSHITIGGVVVTPKKELVNTFKQSTISAKIKSIEIEGFKAWDMLFSDKILAKSIIVEQPKWVIYKKDEQVSVHESVVTPFEKIISVSNVYLHHGDLQMIYFKNKNTIISAHNVNLQVKGILINKTTIDDKIPVKYKNYSVSCDSIYYCPSPFYHMKAKKIKITNARLQIDSYQVIPNYSRREFVAKMFKEKDIYTVFCKSVSAEKIKWGINGDDFFFYCSSIVLNHLDANVYHSKVPTDNLVKKYFYNKLLRDLKFDLKVDTLKVVNSHVVYEEEQAAEEGAGIITLGSFNLTATSISSGFKKETLPDTKIKVKCRFMNTSPLTVNWKFIIMDRADCFNINGTLTNFNFENMAQFTKPYMNLTTKGVMDELYFNFSGDDKMNTGDIAVKYDDLKFTVYQKNNPKKKNKLLTFIADIFVKKDTKDKLKDAHIKINRIPEKSFYNLLWRSIMEGLKKILV